VSDVGVSSSGVAFSIVKFVCGLSTGVVMIDMSLFIIIVSSFSIAAALSRSFALNFHFKFDPNENNSRLMKRIRILNFDLGLI
jgi:hypothetical protein